VNKVLGDLTYSVYKRSRRKKATNLLNKNESEVSKWLTGTHNFTLRSISKIESALGEKIITTPMTSQQQFKGALERAVRVAVMKQTFHQPRIRMAEQTRFVSVIHVVHEHRGDFYTEKEKTILQVA
jgi:hypothetical protein